MLRGNPNLETFGSFVLVSNLFSRLRLVCGLLITGVRMLDGKATDALEASSLGFQLQYVDIFSNCWGPKDDGKTFGKPGPLAAKALKRGAETVSTTFFAQKVENQSHGEQPIKERTIFARYYDGKFSHRFVFKLVQEPCAIRFLIEYILLGQK